MVLGMDNEDPKREETPASPGADNTPPDEDTSRSGIFGRAFQSVRDYLDYKLDSPLKKVLFWVLTAGAVFLALYLALFLAAGAGLKKRTITSMIGVIASDPNKHFPIITFLILLCAEFFCIYWFFFRKVAEDDRNYKMSKNSTYGSADMMSDAQLREVANVLPPEEILDTIVGQMDDTGRKLVSTKANANSNANILAMGTPGSGKTFSFVMPFIIQAIRRRESVVTTDTKGDLFASTSEYARRNGYIVRRLDLRDPATSDGFDLLGELQHDPVRAMTICSMLVESAAAGPDVHSEGAKALLKACLMYTERSPKLEPEERTIGYAYRMLLKGIDGLTNTFTEIDTNIHPELSEAVQAFNSMASGSPNLVGNIITGLATRLQMLQTKAVEQMMSTPDIDLVLPAKKPCIYYVIMPDQHDAMQFAANIFFNCLMWDLTDFADAQPGQKCPITVNVMFEELYSCGYFGKLTNWLSTSRSRGIPIAMIIQSYAQLIDRYDKKAPIIYNDCATHLLLAANDQETASLFSWRSGEATIEVQTDQHDAREPLLNLGGLKHSTGDGRRSILTENEVMELDEGKCIVAWQRRHVRILNTYGYINHPEYKMGHMPKIGLKRKVRLIDTEAKDYIRQKEQERVFAYEKWLADGGDPWPDYVTPAKKSGPATGTEPPEIIPYEQLEEEALAHSQRNYGAKATTWQPPKQKDKPVQVQAARPQSQDPGNVFEGQSGSQSSSKSGRSKGAGKTPSKQAKEPSTQVHRANSGSKLTTVPQAVDSGEGDCKSRELPTLSLQIDDMPMPQTSEEKHYTFSKTSGIVKRKENTNE